MIAHYNNTRKTLTIRCYNFYGRVVKKQRTLPIPREERERFKWYTGGKPLLLEDMEYLEKNNLIIEENGEQ